MAKRKQELLVAMGTMQVSRDPNATIITRGLGSCIGLSVYDPEARIGGLVHSMLPLSSLDDGDMTVYPCLFVDTGVAALLQAVLAEGAQRERLIICAAGAAALLSAGGPLQIGERNRLVLSKILEKNGLQLAADDLGGRAARSMYLKIADGSTVVLMNGVKRIL